MQTHPARAAAPAPCRPAGLRLLWDHSCSGTAALPGPPRHRQGHRTRPAQGSSPSGAFHAQAGTGSSPVLLLLSWQGLWCHQDTTPTSTNKCQSYAVAAALALRTREYTRCVFLALPAPCNAPRGCVACFGVRDWPGCSQEDNTRALGPTKGFGHRSLGGSRTRRPWDMDSLLLLASDFNPPIPHGHALVMGSASRWQSSSQAN